METLCTQRNLWLACMNAQAKRSLPWLHKPKGHSSCMANKETIHVWYLECDAICSVAKYYENLIPFCVFCLLNSIFTLLLLQIFLWYSHFWISTTQITWCNLFLQNHTGAICSGSTLFAETWYIQVPKFSRKNASVKQKDTRFEKFKPAFS